MAALIPSRTDPEANVRAIAAVRADKEREAGDGFDGTWVAHPDVVGVATAAFDAVLGKRPNQIERLREEVVPDAAALADLGATPGQEETRRIFEAVALGDDFPDFLTELAYELLD